MKRKTFSKIVIAGLMLLICTTCRLKAENEKSWQLGPFIRPVNSPIVAPNSESTFKCPMRDELVRWESSDTFNPASIVYNDEIYVLYRAEDGSGTGLARHTSRIGLAKSNDGIMFQRYPEPVLYPANDSDKPYDWRGGCEDPRIVEGPDGTFYMYYTLYSRDNPVGGDGVPKLGVASSTDLKNWKKHGPIFMNAYEGKYVNMFHKAASVVTSIQDGRLKAVKINGKYLMYWGERSIKAAVSDDLLNWTPVLNNNGSLLELIKPRKDKFDSLLTEAGPPAVLTDEGIVLLYNGKNSGADKSIGKGAYAAGQLLLDKNEPFEVLDRSETYFFYPECDFEKTGQYVDGTVFVEGLTYFNNKWYLYYGTADSYVGVAIWCP